MPKRGGKRKKTKTHEGDAPEGATVLGQGALKVDVPRSIVAKASKVIPHVAELVRDIRKLMSPNTAASLREKSYNRMKDYTEVAGILGVTHIIAISQTKSNVVLRIARYSSGPTLHFRILEYSLSRHVRLLQKRPYEAVKAYTTAPLVVLNNFGQSEESHVKLMRVTFQNMFPSINVKTVKLSDCRRVVLFHFLKEEGVVEVRHYAIRANPVGINRNVKRILQAKIPDLSQLEDMSELLDGSQGLGQMSDSEAEDETTRVILPDKFIGKGNTQSQQSAMKLSELGPRLKLELFKVERGVCEGDVLYHKDVQKTPAEEKALKERVEKQRMLKMQRKAEQDANVKRKRELVDAKRQTKQEKKRQRLESGKSTGNKSDDDDDNDDESDDDDRDDDYDGGVDQGSEDDNGDDNLGDENDD